MIDNEIRRCYAAQLLVSVFKFSADKHRGLLILEKHETLSMAEVAW
jgi:hypothetical protein